MGAGTRNFYCSSLKVMKHFSKNFTLLSQLKDSFLWFSFMGFSISNCETGVIHCHTAQSAIATRVSLAVTHMYGLILPIHSFQILPLLEFSFIQIFFLFKRGCQIPFLFSTPLDLKTTVPFSLGISFLGASFSSSFVAQMMKREIKRISALAPYHWFFTLHIFFCLFLILLLLRAFPYSLIVLEFFFREHQTNEIQAKICAFLYLRLCSFRKKKFLQNPPPGTLPKNRLRNSYIIWNWQ